MHLLKNSRFRLSLVLGLVLLLAFGLVGTAQAFEFPDGELIDQDTVINDDIFIMIDKIQIDGVVNGVAFINSSTAILNGTINGDLVVMAAAVEINGQVNGNLIASGQIIQINGQVSGSTFVLGNTTTLTSQARIDRNLYMMGYCLDMQPGSQIGIDISLNGYQALLNGQVGRDALVNVAAFELSGQVAGNVELAVSPPDDPETFATPLFYYFLEGPGVPLPTPGGIRIAPQASIRGDLRYTSPVEQPKGIPAGVIAGDVTYTLTEDTESTAALRRQLFQSRVHELVTLLVLGGAVLWLLPGPLSQAAEKVRRPLPALGRGILLTLAGYLALGTILLLMVVITILLVFVNLKGLAQFTGWIGVSSAVLALATFAILAIYGSKLVVASMVGRWIFQRLRPGYSGHPYWPLLVGVLIYILLSAIPILPLHSLFVLCVTAIGMGAMWLAYRSRRQSNAPAPLNVEDHAG